MAVVANPNVPHIQEPLANVAALTAVTRQLKQGVESLGGHRGGSYDRAVTLQDLITLGVVTPQMIDTLLRGPP